VKAEQRLYRVLDFQVGLPTMDELAMELASKFFLKVPKDGVDWPGLKCIQHQMPGHEPELPVPVFEMLLHFLLELCLVHAPDIIYQDASPGVVALAALRLAVMQFGKVPRDCEEFLKEQEEKLLEAHVKDTFKFTGKIGLRLTEDGIVKEDGVLEGRARDAGVEVGWQISSIDGQSYSSDLLRERIADGSVFRVTFLKKVGKKRLVRKTMKLMYQLWVDPSLTRWWKSKTNTWEESEVVRKWRSRVLGAASVTSFRNILKINFIDDPNPSLSSLADDEMEYDDAFATKSDCQDNKVGINDSCGISVLSTSAGDSENISSPESSEASPAADSGAAWHLEPAKILFESEPKQSEQGCLTGDAQSSSSTRDTIDVPRQSRRSGSVGLREKTGKRQRTSLKVACAEPKKGAGRKRQRSSEKSNAHDDKNAAQRPLLKRYPLCTKAPFDVD